MSNSLLGTPDPLADLAQSLQPAIGVPPIANAATPTQDPVQPAPQPGGRLRSLLSNFFQGAGAAMMQHVGLPTPQEQAQEAFNNNLKLRQQKSLEDTRDIQSENAALKLHIEQQKAAGAFVTPEMAQAVPRLLPMVGKPLPDAFAKLMGTQVTAAAGTENAEIGADSREKVATENAQNKPPNELELIRRSLAGDKNSQAILDQFNKNKRDLAWARGESMGYNRTGGYIDPDTGILQTATAGTAIKQGMVPAAPGAQAMSKQAQFGEMKTASTQFRSAIMNLDRDFTPEQRIKLQYAMQAPDESVIHTLRDSMLGTEQLTPAQQDFVVWAAQMHERALSLRNVAGIGQGAQDTRAAIQATVPNITMANKAYGIKQLDAMDQQISSLYKGAVKLPGGGGTAGPTVRIRYNGQTGTIPASSLQKYQKLGATVLGKK